MCSKSDFITHDTSDNTEFSILVSLIQDEFEKSDTINIDRIKTLLGNYKSTDSDWKKYTTWDPHKYTRNLVDQGNGKYNLLILCWGESQVSPVHSHPNSNCFVKILSGEMLETIFALPTNDNEREKLKILSETELKRDEVTYMHDSIGIHAMENPNHSEGAVTLHLYVPPYMECDVYDIRSGKRSKSGMCFTTKGGIPVTH